VNRIYIHRLEEPNDQEDFEPKVRNRNAHMLDPLYGFVSGVQFAQMTFLKEQLTQPLQYFLASLIAYAESYFVDTSWKV